MVNLFIQVLWWVLHPFYVSITTVDFNEGAQRLEISCRIFYDDLETALRAEGGVASVDLIRPADRKVTDSLVARYLRRYVALSVDGRRQPLHYLGYEIEDDVAWCYLEATGVPAVKRLTLDNRVLFAQFDKQSHIIHATAYGERKSTKLDNPAYRASFTW